MANTEKLNEFDIFLQTLSDEMASMHEAEILDGVDENELRNKHIGMLDKAKKEAGRRRLLRAKESMIRKSNPIELDTPQVSIIEARRYLEHAMNDPNYTMAARTLSEMSDEDILNFYSQVIALEKLQTAP